MGPHDAPEKNLGIMVGRDAFSCLWCSNLLLQTMASSCDRSRSPPRWPWRCSWCEYEIQPGTFPPLLEPGNLQTEPQRQPVSIHWRGITYNFHGNCYQYCRRRSEASYLVQVCERGTLIGQILVAHVGTGYGNGSGENSTS